ncbi:MULTISPECIES: acyl-CoA dehydrogenase family protein [unclassified Mycobacterium]|uniref:acyl-CoA dehydrogenase family protein n=1 Tax=unclassified Mycobacterium TaxID=2642494 RepID=UPI0029C967EA|nr:MULTISPECIES: acyl-CoA dehydrogenase family protein [unclassified Mycobacterium]
MSIVHDVHPTESASAAGLPYGFRDDLTSDLIERARSVQPLLASKAAEHEETNGLSHEVVERLTELELFALAGPQRIGGLAQSSQTMAKVAAELAKGCPSTAWVYTIYNSCLWLASKLPKHIQDQVFADGLPRICSPQNGMGQLVADADGYRLSGRWNYATGSHHSQWTLIPAMSPDQQPALVALPMTAVELEYTWHVAGMKGTGSDTVVASDVKVDTDKVALFSDILVAPPATIDVEDREASDFWPNYPILRAKALGVLVGCAEGILDIIVSRSEGPIIYSIYAHKSDSAAYHASIGEAATQVQAARRIVEGSCERIDAAAREGRLLTTDERIETRGEGALAIQLLQSAVNRLMDLGGSSGFSTSANAQRFWRDYNIASRHVIFNSQISFEQVGRRVLGIEDGVVPPDMI